MKSLKKISYNSLFELQAMVHEIGQVYRKYEHVSDSMPSSVKRELNKLIEQIEEEINLRQEN